MWRCIGIGCLVAVGCYLVFLCFPLVLLVALLLKDTPQIPWWYSAEGGPRA
jgi:hypothetical protein